MDQFSLDLLRRVIQMVEQANGDLLTNDGRVVYSGPLWIDTPDGRPWRAGYRFERKDQIPPDRVNCTLRLNDGRSGQCYLKDLDRMRSNVNLRGASPLVGSAP